MTPPRPTTTGSAKGSSNASNASGGEVEHDPETTDPNAKQPGPDDEDDLPAGTMVGEYRIEERIGKGGMGVVFTAVHPVIGKRVAIKVLRADVCNDRFAVERFIDEARIVNQIEHPNIVDIFAFGELPDGRNYFVMEWLRGESLRTRSERERIPITQVCDILSPLARALLAAHEIGIVHRDLKPDNVFLVDVRGEQTLVKLLDFGVAKLGETDARAKQRVEHTATGSIVGTPQYLSPEQAKGHQVDYRADIYALGAIAFELITNRPPFVADNVMEMVAKHLMEPVAPPSTLVPTIPAELDQLVVATLAKDPAERPSLEDILAVLERVKELPELQGEPRRAQTFTATNPGVATPWPRPSTWPANTPFPTPPRPGTPWPAPTGSAVADAPTPGRSRAPRWIVVGLATATVLVAAVTCFVYLRRDPGPKIEHVQAPMTTEPSVVVMPPLTPTPPTPPPATPVEVPALPAVADVPGDAMPAPKHHHHVPMALGSAAGSGSSAPAVVDDDNDLLEPGSIPASGSAR